jgi:hypothetical protein
MNQSIINPWISAHTNHSHPVLYNSFHCVSHDGVLWLVWAQWTRCAVCPATQFNFLCRMNIIERSKHPIITLSFLQTLTFPPVLVSHSFLSSIAHYITIVRPQSTVDQSLRTARDETCREGGSRPCHLEGRRRVDYYHYYDDKAGMEPVADTPESQAR